MLLDPVVLVWYVYSIYLLFYIYVCLSVYEMCLYDVCIYSYDVYKVWVLLTCHIYSYDVIKIIHTRKSTMIV